MLPQSSTIPRDKYLISYMTLRTIVGLLGIALPIVLIVLFAFLWRGEKLPPSISHYFYTYLGWYFTGTLCAVAFFLFAYNGPEPKDARAANFAAVCALGIVFCPTNICPDCSGPAFIVDYPVSGLRNALHYTFASLLFLTFAYFSLILFTKSQGTKTDRKINRNKIYRICGWLILTSISSIALINFTPIGKWTGIEDFRLWTFLFEAIALLSFGFSWLVKGGKVLPDRRKDMITQAV